MEKRPDIPEYIYEIVGQLQGWIEAAIQPGISDNDAFGYSLHEDALKEQLSILGWSLVLNESTNQWHPCPIAYFIIHNPPLDPLYCPQRSYPVPERPARWDYIWNGQTKISFPSWWQAYEFLFLHDAQMQEQLPMRCYEVRLHLGTTGTYYAARSAEQAIHLHLNWCIQHHQFTPAQAVSLHINVHEHHVSSSKICPVCQAAPCQDELIHERYTHSRTRIPEKTRSL